ncbi:MAG: serine/threonine-protein kinase, partial [Acidobacteria bacterium]|nr:serine/threonine-protein kinase [Acidobacteriota bacterium]
MDFIAMEYVAGSSLDQLLAGKGLRLAEALKDAVPMADALAAAHAAGIIHRDLKPGNIMVNEQGRVKVLDFGLAKLTEPVSSDASAPTETLRVDAPRTEEGTIIGTVAYMSPEQAEGRPVDARSDIFSFGSVLYEMLTRQRAFSGQTRLSTLSAILRDSPKPLRDSLEEIPPDLDKIVARCLRKDVARRFQHMDDVKVALEELLAESESGIVAAAPARAARRVRSSWITAAVTAVAGLALGAGVASWLARSRPAPEPVLTRLTSDAGLTFEPALSPDGKLVAYASDRSGEGNLDIWVQQVGGGLPIRLTHDRADEMQPDFSPDGRTIAFASTRGGGGIYVVPALGGDARLVAEGGRCPRFSPDGREIAYFLGDEVFSGRIQIVASTGGQPRPFHPEFSASHPVWSPDGRRLLFQGRKDRARELWWVAPVDGGPAEPTGGSAALEKRRLQLFGPNGTYRTSWAWSPPGNHILFAARSGDSFNVWRMPVSPSTGHVTGEPQRVTLGTARERAPSGAGDLIAFSSLNSQADLWSLPLDAASGRVTGPLER